MPSRGPAAAGVGVPLLAACGGDDPEPAGDVGGPTINCTCHGSKFSAVDGSVVRGRPPRRSVPRRCR